MMEKAQSPKKPVLKEGTGTMFLSKSKKKEQEKNVGTLLSCVFLDFLPGFVMMPGDRVRECLCQALNLPF